MQFPPLPCPLQNLQVCTYKYVSHQSQFDGEEQQDVDFSADVKLSCQSGELAAHTRELTRDTPSSRSANIVWKTVWGVIHPCYQLPSDLHPPWLPPLSSVGTFGSQSATRYCIQVQNVQLSSDILQTSNRYAVTPATTRLPVHQCT